jgi:hypothetical protein
MKTQAVLIVALILTTSCSDSSEQASKPLPDNLMTVNQDIAQFELVDKPLPVSQPNPDRNAYFGDLHVHTEYSLDAYAYGTTSTPVDAYRYAQGEAISHPSGYQVQLSQPLDFYAVTDHAFFLGLAKEAGDTSTEFSRNEAAEPFHDLNAPGNDSALDRLLRSLALGKFARGVRNGILEGSIAESSVHAVARSAWQQSVEAANEAYKPGVFTTFAAFEYTASTDQRENLHRNVVFRNSSRLPAIPFSRLNTMNPEGLWDWMDGLRDQGIESLAMPHNSNGSNGKMFMLTDQDGNAIDEAYASQRMRNEPLVEITQVKGTSDTHPLLSKNDEWANFEIMPYRVSTKLHSEPAGSYVRDAWLRGLAIAEGGVNNPYKFGVIGSSDTHNGASSLQEETYFSKIGLIDGTADMRGSIPLGNLYGNVLKVVLSDMVTEVDGEIYMAPSSIEYWSASGLAGVWAEENTREAIYDALRRKETFGTSGPRMKVRFFAGYELANVDLDSPELIQATYTTSVSMGGTLQAEDNREPMFLVWAAADPNGASLQRVQVIKGWLANGEHHEQVYDAACSDGLKVDPETNRCPDNGARVDLSDCSYSTDFGAPELKTLWRDPDFEESQEAFYYVRVLENPTCRWSTWDALKNGTPPRSDLPSTIQERAWSSPIWYTKRSDS